jgi:hypothetical protein
LDCRNAIRERGGSWKESNSIEEVMISAAAIKYRLAWHLPSEVEVSIDVLTKYKLVIFLKQGKTSRLRDIV